MDSLVWGDFRRINGVSFNPADWRETIDGGQAFTWFKTETDGEYAGVFGNAAAKIRLLKDGAVAASFPRQLDTPQSLAALEAYLDAGTDYGKIRSALKNTRDISMLRALKAYPTLRILRQNPAEAIVCFICSSSKRIVQIKQCVNLLSKKFGKKICGDFYALPDFQTLAEAGLPDILACKLGFRARYLQNAARKITADKFDPQDLRSMGYAEAKKYLVSLSGIGDKVADCILLFGCARFEAFPVDTWILQAMRKLYNTEADAKKVRLFAAQKFPLYAGFAQQLLFATARNNML